MAKIPVNEDPSNLCFGCSPHNERGLGMKFDEREDGVVESRMQVARELVGPPGVVHGGIQAVLLDEVMGVLVSRIVSPETTMSVTAELSVKYRRPLRAEQPIVLRARLCRSEGKNHFVEGEILDAGDEVLTKAEARFKTLS